MMSGALAEWKAEWKREVIKEVTREVTEEVTKEVKTKHVLRMLEDGVFSLDKIAKYTELPLEQVKALAEQRTAR